MTAKNGPGAAREAHMERDLEDDLLVAIRTLPPSEFGELLLRVARVYAERDGSAEMQRRIAELREYLGLAGIGTMQRTRARANDQK